MNKLAELCLVHRRYASPCELYRVFCQCDAHVLAVVICPICHLTFYLTTPIIEIERQQNENYFKKSKRSPKRYQ